MPLYPSRRWARRIVVALLGLLPLAATAQQIDPTFPTLELRAINFNYQGATVRCTVPDAAGGVLVTGNFDFAGPTPRGNVLRLLPGSGNVDPAFNAGGTGANGLVSAAMALPNGQWLIGGVLTRYNGVAVDRIARLNADGTLDNTFAASSAGANAQILSFSLDAQGRILVGGTFTRFGGQATVGVARLLPSGQVDPVFRADASLVNPVCWAVTPDANGNLLVGGSLGPAPGGTANRGLVRLLPTGALDPAFATTTAAFQNAVRAVLPLPGGGFVVAGSSGNNGLGPVRRLTAAGVPGASITGLTSGAARAVALTASGKILVAGSNLRPVGQTTYNKLVQLNADGTLDAGFTPALVTSGNLAAVYVLPNGKIITGGYLTDLNSQPNTGLVRLTATGQNDASFADPAFDHRGGIQQLVLQSGDRPVITGYFRSFNGTAVSPISRLTPDGALDRSFQIPTTIETTLMTRDGASDRLFVAGNIHTVRLQANGALDGSFDDGVGAEYDPNGTYSFSSFGAVAGQPDGKVLVGGNFRTYNGQAHPNLVRLLPSGAVDPSFTAPDGDTLAYVNSIVVLPNGTMVVGYEGVSSAGNYGNFVRWLTATGQPLASFNGGQPVENAIASTPFGDNTIWLTTDLYQPTAITRRVDATNTPVAGFALDAAAQAVGAGPAYRLPDGSYVGTTGIRDAAVQTGALYRLSPSGALDNAFNPVQFGNGYLGGHVTSITRLSTGNLLVAGEFTTANGQLRPALVRLTAIPLLAVQPESAVSPRLAVYPNPAHDFVQVETTASGPLELLDARGTVVRRLPTGTTRVTLTGLPAGLYILRAGAASQRVVVE